MCRKPLEAGVAVAHGQQLVVEVPGLCRRILDGVQREMGKRRLRYHEHEPRRVTGVVFDAWRHCLSRSQEPAEWESAGRENGDPSLNSLIVTEKNP